MDFQVFDGSDTESGPDANTIILNLARELVFEAKQVRVVPMMAADASFSLQLKFFGCQATPATGSN